MSPRRDKESRVTSIRLRPLHLDWLTSDPRLVLTYLIPCHLLNTHTLPSTHLLAPYPRLERLFRPLAQCIKKGDLAGFDSALATGEDEFVKRRIYLTLERGRDIALRNLFRKVFLAGGFEESKDGSPPIRRTRIPLKEFGAAVRLGNRTDSAAKTDMDEVECLLANLIYKVCMAADCLLTSMPPTERKIYYASLSHWICVSD